MMVANGRWCRSTVYGQFQRARVGAVVAASVAAPPHGHGPGIQLWRRGRSWSLGQVTVRRQLAGAFSADSVAVLVGCTAALGRAFGRLDQSVVRPAAN